MKKSLSLPIAALVGIFHGCANEQDQYTEAYARQAREITRLGCADTLAFRRSFDSHTIPPSIVLSFPTEYSFPQGYIDLNNAREQCLRGSGTTRVTVGRRVVNSEKNRERMCDTRVEQYTIRDELYEAAGIRGRFQSVLRDADRYIAACRENGMLPRE